MNQLDLILENIRLKHIEKLLLEATTDEEVQRGMQLINESMSKISGTLHQMLVEDGWSGFSNDNTWADERGFARRDRRALDRIEAQPVEHDIHPESIPGEPALVKPAGNPIVDTTAKQVAQVAQVAPVAQPRKLGLGASLMNRRF